MKKPIFLLLSLLLLTFPLNAQKADFPFNLMRFESTDQFNGSEQELKGKVRTLLTSTYSNNKVRKTTVETFDTQKRRQEFISHNADIEVHSEELMALTAKKVYSYNSKNGKLDLIFRFDEKDKLWGKTKLIYDSKGLLQEEITYSEKNDLSSKLSYIYDKQKMEVTANYTSYSKDSEGKTVSNNTRSVRQYNEKGQLIRRVRFGFSGDIWDTASFKYDEKGLLVEENSCYGKNCGSPHTFEYVFDKHGNWIERIEVFTRKDENGEINYYEYSHIFRTITYYPDNLK